MNFDEILINILIVADYPADKRDGFINTFYRYLFTEIFAGIGKTDMISAQKFGEVIQNSEENADWSKQVLQKLYQNPGIKEKVDNISNAIIYELADDIVNSATESQKQQILAFLPK